MGGAPVISYHNGARNYGELKGLLRKSLVIVTVFAGGMLITAHVLAKPLSVMFVGYSEELLEMTLQAFGIYKYSFMFAGFAIFISAFFTALNDGLTSAIVSFLRTLVFQVLAVLLLPLVWGLNGIWLSIVMAEVMAVLVAVLFLVGKGKNYHYLG